MIRANTMDNASQTTIYDKIVPEKNLRLEREDLQVLKVATDGRNLLV